MEKHGCLLNLRPEAKMELRLVSVVHVVYVVYDETAAEKTETTDLYFIRAED